MLLCELQQSFHIVTMFTYLMKSKLITFSWIMKYSKAHRQITKKRCFKKYYSCDKACYLEIVTIDDKFKNKNEFGFAYIKPCYFF